MIWVSTRNTYFPSPRLNRRERINVRNGDWGLCLTRKKLEREVGLTRGEENAPTLCDMRGKLKLTRGESFACVENVIHVNAIFKNFYRYF